MTILIFSDSHHSRSGMYDAIEAHKPQQIIHLGDLVEDAEDVSYAFPQIPFCMVPGNCDFGSTAIPIRQETFGGKRFYFTHGHRHDVKYTLYRLEMAAREAEVDIALFGHTHQPYEEYVDGLYLFNPGSLRYGRTYGYVDFVGGGIRTAVVELR